jgi:hypothetical protein
MYKMKALNKAIIYSYIVLPSPKLWSRRYHFISLLMNTIACDDAEKIDQEEIDQEEDSNQEKVEDDLDPDNDGLLSDEENSLGTDPNNPDSDEDGIQDGQEVDDGTDPLKSDSDDDGLSDSEEQAIQTDPLNADSDEDGFEDGFEADYNTDPLDPQSYPIKPENGDWMLSNPDYLSDGCNLEEILSNFGADLFSLLPDSYTIINTSYDSFEIDISSENAVCAIESSSFTCNTISITEEITEVTAVLSVDLSLTGNLNSNTEMDTVLNAYFSECVGDGCGIMSLFGVSIPCSVEVSADGNY